MTEQDIVKQIHKAMRAMEWVINCAEEAIDEGYRAIVALEKGNMEQAILYVWEACDCEDAIRENLQWRNVAARLKELHLPAKEE